MTLGPHFCYIIANGAGRTYNGYTNQPDRRIRQHCGLIQGGAKATRGKGPWHFVVVIELLALSYQQSLSFEWSMRYPTNRRPRPKQFSTPMGRLETLPLVFLNPKFAATPARIKVYQPYVKRLQELMVGFDNVVVIPDDELTGETVPC